MTKPAKAMTLKVRVQDAIEYVEWLRQAVHDKTLPANNRTRAAGSCYSITQDHHVSIVLLSDQHLYASSFALMRSVFEAYVRGQWLALCATDDQVDKYLHGKEPPPINTLLTAIELTAGFSEKVLSRAKTQAWASMCDYAHTGGLHVQRWNTCESIESNFSEDEILEVIDFSEAISIMSVLGVAELANDDELKLRILSNTMERDKKRTST
jgi:hypothetical protein